MPAVTIRNIPEQTHRALKARARRHGRSTEAEIREILNEATRPDQEMKLGTALKKLGEEIGGFDIEIERDRSPPRPVSFE